MDGNMVSNMPEMAPMAEFDKSPPSPMEMTPGNAPLDDLPPPPSHSVGHSPKKQNTCDEEEWGCGSWVEYIILLVLSMILLLAALVLVLFWALYYRGGFGWQDNPMKEFNLHPVLMVTGYIFFSGFSILLYRIFRCCGKTYGKLFHLALHVLTIPCIAMGFVSIMDFHSLAQPPIPHFYSIHSWLGLVTTGLFGLQFLVGFFSFIILLCCKGATAAFRASLVPIHSSFGIITFMLAVATCLTGLTQKALLTFGETYQNWPEEGIIVNAMAMVFVGLGILLSYVVRRDTLRNKSDCYDNERL